MNDFPYIVTAPVIPQIRLGQMGPPGYGKTTAALTFPNPVVLSKDRKEPPGTKVVPFYDREFEKFWSDKRIDRSGPRSALINFLKKEGPKFDPSTTLILDSWTMWFQEFDMWAEEVAPLVYCTKGGPNKPSEVDNFKIHADRITYGYEIMMAMKALPCHCIIDFHEQTERDQNGNAIGIKLVCKGQFGDQAASHVTSFFRNVKKENDKKEVRFYWQVLPTSEFKGTILPINVKPRSTFIEPTYENYIKLLENEL